MEQRLDKNNSEPVFTLDLDLNIDENSLNLSEIDSTYVADSDLMELVDSINENESKSDENPSAQNQQADDIGLNYKSKQFETPTEEQVDEIALNTCKKATHKQTTWGINVFKGKLIFIIF